MNNPLLKFRSYLLFYPILISLLLTGCGGGPGAKNIFATGTLPDANSGANPSGATTSNSPPIVEAGTNQIAEEQTNVTLAGNATDDDGSITSFRWTQTAGTPVTLSANDAALTSFDIPDILEDEIATFLLTVVDDLGAESSDTIDVNFTARANVLPDVDAGIDQTVDEQTIVSLNGAGSDTDGNVVSFEWVQISGPSVTLSTPDAAQTEFTAPTISADEAATFELTVVDNQGGTSVDLIGITILTVIDTPQNTQAVVGDGEVIISWDSVTGADSYNVYFAQESFGSPAAVVNFASLQGGNLLLDIADPSQTLSSLTNGVTYFISVSAIDARGESPPTTELLAIPAQPTSLAVVPELAASFRAASMIDSAGGTITTTDSNGMAFSLTIPASAVMAETEIAITPVMEVPNTPFINGIFGGIQFEPDGFVLAEPATLMIEVPSDVNPLDVIAIGWDGAGDNAHLEIATQVGNQLTFIVPHFSGVAAGTGRVDAAALATSGTDTLEGKYINIMTVERESVYRRICGSRFPIECFDRQNGFDDVRYNNVFIEMVQKNTALWLDELSILARNSSTSPEDLQLLSREFFAWNLTTRVLLCGDQGNCEDYPTAYVEKAQAIRLDIARGVLAAFDRALADHDDTLVSSLIAQVEQFGSDAENPDEIGFYAAFLTLLEQPAGTSLDFELRQRYGSQLVIEVINFPTELRQGGSSVDFSVQLSYQAKGEAVNTTPLAGISVLIGPNGIGCATVNSGRGFVSYTTNSSGMIDGLRVAAGNSCTEPTNQSLVFIRTEDEAVGATTDAGGLKFYLGREIAFGATQQNSSVNITSENWGIDADVSFSCAFRDDECVEPDNQRDRTTGTSLTQGSDARAAGVTSSRGSADASASINYGVGPDLGTGQLLKVRFDSTAFISVSATSPTTPNFYGAGADASAASSARLEFQVLENEVTYSMDWSAAGFAGNLSDVGSSKAKISLVQFLPTSQLVFNSNTSNDPLSLSGTLEPGSYRIVFICGSDVELTVVNGTKAHSDSGSCTFNFTID